MTLPTDGYPGQRSSPEESAPPLPENRGDSKSKDKLNDGPSLSPAAQESNILHLLNIRNGMAHCPAHDDSNRSLSVTKGDDGRVLLHCHAGCPTEKILEALNLTMADLFPSKAERKRHEIGRRIHEYPGYRKIIISYSDNTKTAFFERLENGAWVKGLNGQKQTLYNANVLNKPGIKYISESEKDADRLNGLNLLALSFGGAENWKPEYADLLAGHDIVILPHHDEPGRKAADKVAHDLMAKGCKVKIIPSETWGAYKGADVADWIDAGHTREDLEKVATDTLSHSETPISWHEPIHFGEIETPEIPCNLLQGFAGKFAQAVTDSAQTPPGVAVMMTLAVLATCLQKRIEVSPYQDDYIEPVNIWTNTALDPGTRKTAIKIAVTAPLLEFEKQKHEELKEKIKETEDAINLNKSRIKQLMDKASKPDTTAEEREQYIKDIAKIRDETPDEIKPPQLWTDDCTPERLQDLLVDNGERMALLSDEGGIFEVMAGLYSGGKANVNVFLQAHAGASVRVDRKGRAVALNKPALTFGLTVQPGIIRELGQGNKSRFRANGVLARFLYCIPKSTVGHRDVRRRSIIPEVIKSAYYSGIKSMLGIEPVFDELGREVARTLTLMPDALQAWEQFSQYIESKQGPQGEYFNIQDWTSKLPGAALRIAGIMHMVEHGLSITKINERTMARSLDLCEILISHAQAAFDIMGDDPACNDAKIILQWIIDRNEPSFRKNSIFTDIRRFRNLERVEKALKALIARHIISEPMKVATKGRPSIVYFVNPEILSRKA